MLRREIIFILMLLVSLDSFSQVPDTSDSGIFKKIKPFIKENYKLLDMKVGRLNDDTLNDVVIILKPIAEDSLFNIELNRPILILFQMKDKSFKLGIQNDSLVLCKYCGGMVDPYGGLSVDKNIISLSFYGGISKRWTRELEFQYSKQSDNFILTKDDEGGYDTLDLDARFPVQSRIDSKKPKLFIDKYTIGWD